MTPASRTRPALRAEHAVYHRNRPLDICAAVGADLLIIPDDKKDTTYYGGTVTIGVGVGMPGGEMHVEWGETATADAYSFNVFDVGREIYRSIMEW